MIEYVDSASDRHVQADDSSSVGVLLLMSAAFVVVFGPLTMYLFHREQ